MPNELAAPSAPHQLAAASPLAFLQSAIATFDGIEKVAGLMAKMGTMPAHLQGKPADCFRIVVQSAKWGMDPFAVAECTSLVHGRLCYEGKLVAAVLRATGAIEGRLTYEITGKGQDASIVVTGTPRGGAPCSVSGTVKEWATTHAGSPWAKQPETMLVYRGTRQWARLYAPESLLGVYTPDEREDVREVEAVVTGSVPEAKPGKDRDAEPEAGTPFQRHSEAVHDQAAAAPAAPAAPTAKELNEAAIALHGAFKGKATDELKAITKQLGIEKISACPAERIAECLALVKAAHAKLAAAPQAGAQ